MISDVAKKRAHSCPGQHAIDPANGKKPGFQTAIERTLMPLAILATVGMMTIAPAAAARTALDATNGRSSAETMQHSTCAADTQGLLCSANNRELQADSATVQTPPASTSLLLQPLSNVQMERLADILLGLLYFVLPTGVGVALFLYDRRQAQRAAMLDAQIKLLEKLWQQSPQAE